MKKSKLSKEWWKPNPRLACINMQLWEISNTATMTFKSISETNIRLRSGRIGKQYLGRFLCLHVAQQHPLDPPNPPEAFPPGEFGELGEC